MPVHRRSPRDSVATLEQVLGVVGGCHSVLDVEQVHEEVVGERPGRSVKTPWVGTVGVGAEHPQAADEHGHLGGAQRQQLRPVDQQVLGRRA